MHIAYTGPRILEIDSEGYPVQPYGIKENPYSILDVADIVYVNPVNTGYSRILVKDTPKEKFFGVNADIKYLGEWLTNFVSRKGRWTSAKWRKLWHNAGLRTCPRTAERALDVPQRRDPCIADRPGH
jgi:carboxypeptidase C (cathepsin A)